MKQIQSKASLVALGLSFLVSQVVWGNDVGESDREFSDPPVVFEWLHQSYRFEADGSGESLHEARARPQNAAGVQQLGEVVWPYLKSRSSVTFQYLRMRKPDGTVSEADLSKVKDLPAPVAAMFPVYSDLHLLHATTPALRPGDIVEYSIAIQTTHPDTPGNFSVVHDFERSRPVTQEILEVDIPASVAVHWRSANGLDPTVRETAARRTYHWERSNPTRRTEKITSPDVELSSFPSWDDVGSWYLKLAEGRATPDRAIRKLAREITREATTDRERLEAIYHHVAAEIRYLSLSLGVARYQPQFAGDALRNGYGDCKDKHTLLQALAAALDIEAHPVLISSSLEVSEEVAAPTLFDHVITLVRLGDERIWLDATGQITPFGYLSPGLRGKLALVLDLDGVSKLERTPEELPFAPAESLRFEGTVSATGDLAATVVVKSRGDQELGLRSLFFASPPTLREGFAEALLQRLLGGAFELDAFSTSSLTETHNPLELTFEFHLPAGRTRPLRGGPPAPRQGRLPKAKRYPLQVSREPL